MNASVAPTIVSSLCSRVLLPDHAANEYVRCVVLPWRCPEHCCCSFARDTRPRDRASETTPPLPLANASKRAAGTAAATTGTTNPTTPCRPS